MHTYENPGHYTATVTATDSVDSTASDNISFDVALPTTGGEGTTPEPTTAGGDTTTTNDTSG